MGSTNNPNPERSIDKRLDLLLKSGESHDEQLGKLIDRIDKLAETSERRERDTAGFNRMLRAALQAYLLEPSCPPRLCNA